MEEALIFALKKIGGGITSVFVIALILKTKASKEVDIEKKLIQNQFKTHPKEAKRLYGDDIDAYLSQLHPNNDSLIELMVVSAFRPLLILSLISMFDLHTPLMTLFLLILVLFIVPIETYYGEKLKANKLYVWAMLALWITAFGILIYSKTIDSEKKHSAKSEIHEIIDSTEFSHATY